MLAPTLNYACRTTCYWLLYCLHSLCWFTFIPYFSPAANLPEKSTALLSLSASNHPFNNIFATFVNKSPPCCWSPPPAVLAIRDCFCVSSIAVGSPCCLFFAKMLSCHCLNVIIETEGELQNVTAETLGLSEEEVQDSFFKDVRQVAKLININKTHSGLIHTRNVGSWVIHCCINCDVHSHAVHREKGASCVLVNYELFNKETIEKLYTTDSFSTLYKIIINSDNVEDDFPTYSYLPSEVENVIKGLKQIAADALKNEAVEVEERIKRFSDEQYSKLSALRERTFKEQQILIRIILNNSENAKPASTSTGMSNPQGMPSRLNEPLDAGSVKLAASPGASSNPFRGTPKRQKSCPAGHLTSFDAEGLFEFEATDEFQSGTGSEIEESDVDDPGREEGVKIPKRGGTINPIAKSLPMNIPAFLSMKNRMLEEEDEEPETLDPNTDIAASMKALARSVHGEPVFGDLPKPRYTYI